MTTTCCALCGLPLRFGSHTGTFGDRDLRFCCTGCRMVYAMLMEAGEQTDSLDFRQTDLYRRCVEAGVIPASEADLARMRAQEKTRGEDAPGDAARAGILEAHFELEGMWCPACAWVVEDAALKMGGVVWASCNFATDAFHCRYDPVETAPDAIADAVARLGYTVVNEDRDSEAGALRGDFVRLCLSLILSANIMMLSWALYSGFFTRISSRDAAFISWPIAAMATFVLLYGGGPVLRKAWSGLRARAPGMEVLIAMGAGSAYLYSLFNLLQGSIHLYFDTASMLISLLLLGKLLEDRAKVRVRRDLARFMALKPRKVRLCSQAFPDGRFVAIEQLAVGDTFRVTAGETVAADGMIAHGGVVVDTSAITGESKTVALGRGDSLVSGFRIVDGDARVMTRRIGSEALLGQMIAIVRESLARKTRFESKTDRALGVFVPVMAILASAAGVGVLFAGGSLDEAVLRAVTVLVIACPCALGIAIPLARVAGIAGAGRRGILVRGFEAFERMAGIDTLVFDKTGTLTRGAWRLETVTTRSLAEQAAVGLALGLEAGVDHAVSRAVSDYARNRKIPAARVTGTRVDAEGVSGLFNGRRMRFGSRAYALPEKTVPAILNETDCGDLSPVYLSMDGDPVAVFLFGDTLKPGVPELMQTLRGKGYELHLVSGDTVETTRTVAEKVHIAHARGGLTPEVKASRIDDLQARGHYVLMMGDGVNDAPAMAKADLALAIPSGAELAKEAADVTLMRGDPRQILAFQDWARLVNRKVNQNIACAFVYNLISILPLP